MSRIVRSCVQSILKLVNSLIAMVGMAMILYALWMIKVWQRHMDELPFGGSDHPAPWFMYTFLGLGITLCVITCTGHVAAETANGCCLYLEAVTKYFAMKSYLEADNWIHDTFGSAESIMDLVV